MAINSTPKEMPTGDGNPTAGAINGPDSDTAHQHGKAFATLKLTRPMLTDALCRNATCPPDKKRKRLTDGGGLYLEVSPVGSKRWFQKIYRDGKETRFALGSYPTVSLTAARRARDVALPFLEQTGGLL